VSSKQLIVHVDSATGDYIGTVAIGQEYLSRWEALSLPWWNLYCSQHGLGLVALVKPFHDPGRKRVDWQKLLLGKAVIESGLEARNICFVDYDMLPNPFAPNVFNQVDEQVGFVSQIKNLPYGDVNATQRRVAFHRNRVTGGRYPLDSSITARPQDIFERVGLSPLSDFGCGGLLVFNSGSHAHYFEDVFYRYTSQSVPADDPGEQVFLNYHIQRETELKWLNYEWQTLWFYEMANYYPWLYEKVNRSPERVNDAVLSVLLRANFLHFVGSWEKWAWPATRSLFKPEILEQLASFWEYRNSTLRSPTLGLIMPEDPDELTLISR